MGKGGARNRSGPQIDEGSFKSARRGITLAPLPTEGFKGDVPEFPLPDHTVREAEVWWEAWRTPQAAAWILEPWRHRMVAMWVRLSVRCEDREAGAALLAQLHRFSDQIGLTPAGLVENGWKIAGDEVTAKRSEKVTEARPSSRTRLRVVPSGDQAA